MPEKTGDDWETWYDDIPVSGEIRVGVVQEFNKDELHPRSLYTLVPENKLEYLCVEINSKDGRYKAQRQYKTDQLQEGINELMWPTNHSKDLEKFKTQDLVILSSLRETCDDDPVYYTLSSWSNTFDSDTLYILLKSEDSPAINIYDKNTRKENEFQCQSLRIPPMVTFDCICAIPKSYITPQSDVQILKRIRELNSIDFKSYTMPIRLDK